MNRVLASVLATLNSLVAIFIIVAGGLVGFSSARTAGYEPAIGVIGGLLVGAVAAGLVCGLIAYVVLIEGHLRRLASDR